MASKPVAVTHSHLAFLAFGAVSSSGRTCHTNQWRGHDHPWEKIYIMDD